MNNTQVNQFEISGKILKVGMPEDYTTKSGTTGSSRTIIMQVFSGQYESPVAFDFNNVNMKEVEKMKEGEWWTIGFELKGNKTVKDGKEKYWNKLNGLTAMKG